MRFTLFKYGFGVVLSMALWVGLAPQIACCQEVLGTLMIDRSEPTPLWYEYCPADKGVVMLSNLSKNSNRTVGLFKYDGKLQKQWQLELYTQNGNINVEHLAVLNDNIYVFIAERIAGQKKIVTTYFIIGLDGKVLVNGKMLYNGDDHGGEIRNFRFERSLNKKRLLAYHSMVNGKNEDQMAWFQFHADSTLPRQGMITLPYPDEDLQVKQVRVTNQGTIYMLSKLVTSGRSRLTEQAQWLLFKDRAADRKLLEYPLNLQGRVVSDLTCKPDRYENLIVSGFYSTQPNGQLSGVLFARLGANDTLYNFTASPFKESFLTRYLTPRQVERGRGLSDFYMDDIVLRADGGALILAEQYYMTSTSYPDMYGFWQTMDTYHYDDILVISIEPDGELEWISVVEKTQSSDFAGELSYAFVVAPEDIYIFYKTTLDLARTNVYFNTIDFKGEVSKPQPFFRDFSNLDIFFREYCEQVTNTEAFLVYYQHRRRAFTLLKVGF